MLKFHLTKSFHLKLIFAYSPCGEGIQLHPIVNIQDLLWELIKSGLVKFYFNQVISLYSMLLRPRPDITTRILRRKMKMAL